MKKLLLPIAVILTCPLSLADLAEPAICFDPEGNLSDRIVEQISETEFLYNGTNETVELAETSLLGTRYYFRKAIYGKYVDYAAIVIEVSRFGSIKSYEAKHDVDSYRQFRNKRKTAMYLECEDAN